jgi:aminoglycoside 6'-N-acetyltransferase
MSEDDLPSVADWLLQLHVARWWTSTITPEELLALYLLRVKGLDRRTNMPMCSAGGEDVGWCQWYLWEDYREEPLAQDAREGDIGIDYAIGLPTNTGRGLGTHLVATLVDHVWGIHPGAGFLVDPEEANEPSRRVLEKNGFSLSDER